MFANKKKLLGGLGGVALLAGPAVHVTRADVATFQNGLNGYGGTFDRKISLTPANDANGADVNTDTSSYFIDGGGSALNDTGVVQGLLRFDDLIGPGRIPQNALILSATIDAVTTTNSNSQSNGAFNVYRLTTAFDGASSYQTPFSGDGVYGDVARFGGSFNRPANGAPSSARVDRIVQDWVDGSPNLGVAIRSDSSTDGWSFNSTGAGNPANRPKLTVHYTTDPNARVARYRQRVNGYDGTTDLFVNGTSGSNVGTAVPGSAIEQGFLDGSNASGAGNSFDQPYFVRFDNVDLSLPAITRAELVIHTGFGSTNSGTGGSYAVRRILKPWDNGTTYASLDSTGDPTINDLAELVASGFLADGSAETGAVGNAGVVTLDVTDIVQAWKDGAPDYGFYLGSTGTSDGWQIFSSGAVGFGSVDEVTDQLAPELNVFYVPTSSVPEPAGLGLMAVGGAAVLGRRRR
jgi:hypothetical protein